MTAVLDRVIGSQSPRLYSFPDYVSSAGEEVIELAAMAGLDLDPWQQFVLVNALGERLDGKWAASAVGVCVPRQNGKGGIIEARQLGGLFLLDERLQIYSAHLFDTSLEAFRRLSNLVEGRDELSRRVKRISRAHGEEGIELYGPAGRRVTGAQRIRFRTRTKGGGRGFSGDCVYFDEAMIFPEVSHAAILPILSARPNPQSWYTGSAVDQQVHEDGVVFARIRERGIRGDHRLGWFEWSGDLASPEALTFEEPDLVEELLAQANPARGIRITDDAIEDERVSLSPRSFAVERLGVGDWPDTTGETGTAINLQQWDDLLEAASKLDDGFCFAFDVNPERTWSTVAAAGRRADGVAHVEIVDRRRGTSWVPGRIAELSEKHEPLATVCAGSSPASSLVPELEQLGIEVEQIPPKEHAAACGLLYDLVEDERIHHLGSAELRAAMKGAKKRPQGSDGAWLWSRKSSAVDISPLVAITLAMWAANAAAPESEPWMEVW